MNIHFSPLPIPCPPPKKYTIPTYRLLHLSWQQVCPSDAQAKSPGWFLTTFILSQLTSNPSSWLYLWNISRVCSPLPTSAAAPSSTLSSHQDFCNSFLPDLPVISKSWITARLNFLNRGVLSCYSFAKKSLQWPLFPLHEKPQVLPRPYMIWLLISSLTSFLHSLPYPLSDHSGLFVPQTSQAFSSSACLTSPRLTPLLPSGLAWLSYQLTVLFHTAACLLTLPLHSWFMLPCCNFHLCLSPLNLLYKWTDYYMYCLLSVSHLQLTGLPRWC